MTVQGLDAPSPGRAWVQALRHWRPTPAAWTVAATVAAIVQSAGDGRRVRNAWTHDGPGDGASSPCTVIGGPG
jgi:hypothetical protein